MRFRIENHRSRFDTAGIAKQRVITGNRVGTAFHVVKRANVT
jgi:hypothetical protein